MTAPRQILHVDMDAFYASVEQRDDPALRGRPVVVGGRTRGVVAAASYEARQFGIRSAMPMREALRRCPDLCRIPPRMSHYQAVSADVFSIFREFTPLVEGLSLDEAFLDVSDSRALFGDEVRIARAIKAAILDRTGLTASVGVAPNKLVAKIASDLDKPDGLCVVTPDNLRGVLDPLPVSVIPGIGPETLKRLRRLSIGTVGDLRTASDRELEPIFGRFTRRTRERASGIDHRPVEPSRDDKSISAEETFDEDLGDRADLQRKLLGLTEKTATRLRRKALVAGTVQVKIRQADFTTCTRQRSLRPPSSGTDAIYRAAVSLLDDWLSEHPGTAVRLLGVGGSRLTKDAQPDLFGQPEPAGRPELDRAVDGIRERFGSQALGRARALDPEQFG